LQSANEGDIKMRVIVVEGAEMRTASTPKEYTLDGSVDFTGRPAVKGRSGGRIAGVHILGTVLLCSSLPSRPCFLLFQKPFSDHLHANKS
jgi:hypothetical protein